MVKKKRHGAGEWGQGSGGKEVRMGIGNHFTEDGAVLYLILMYKYRIGGAISRGYNLLIGGTNCI